MIPTDPNSTVSTLSTLYHSGAWACLGILVAFLGLRWASQHVAWLEAPGRAHYVAIALGALGIVAAPAAQGTTPNLAMIVSAISGAVMLLLPGAKGSSKTPQAGSARLTLVAVLALAGVVLCTVLPSCSGAQRAAELQALETCGQNDACPIISAVGSAAEQAVQSTSSISAAADAFAANIASAPNLIALSADVVDCIIDVIEAARSVGAVIAGSGSAIKASLAEDPVVSMIHAFRAKHPSGSGHRMTVRAWLVALPKAE